MEIKDIKIGARKSDLARIQAHIVAEKIQSRFPAMNISFVWKESWGDKNLDADLTQQSEKGLFTKDLTEDLLAAKIDLVVHSWKDLPVVSESPLTEVVATLEREDVRDLILLKKTSRKKLRSSETLNLFSSSPRRAYNLKSFFKDYCSKEELDFIPIRGNIPTRFKKLMQNSEVDALVVAKAAVDRMLSASNEEFCDAKKSLRAVLDQCDLYISPVSENPPAPAQGALAIEVLKANKDLCKLLGSLNCEETFDSVSWERKQLARFGGGCHLKLGAHSQKIARFSLETLKGQSPDGVHWNERHWNSEELLAQIPSIEPEEFWPLPSEFRTEYFERSSKDKAPSALDFLNEKTLLWVTKSEALADDWIPHLEGIVVGCPGLKTWKKLVERGVCVNFCAEHCSEDVALERIKYLWPSSYKILKLTHDKGFDLKIAGRATETLATYQLKRNSNPFFLSSKKVFFWKSASLFEAAKNECPEILNGVHFCGCGATSRHIRAQNELSSDQIFEVPQYSFLTDLLGI